MKQALYLLGVLVMCLGASSCKKELSDEGANRYTVEIRLNHVAGLQPLQAGSTYTNAWGEPFTPATFKYYISNLVFVDGSREYPVAGAYFLVDEASPASKILQARLPHGHFTGLRFLLGIDSARHVSGTQTGALDPVHGMFWTWNSGYITAKLEGESPASPAPGQAFTYHIGGFRTGENSARAITINLPTAVNVKEGGRSEVHVNADILSWFSAAHPLRIADHPFVHSPGTLAVQFADNYEHMFTLQSVVNH